MTPDEQHAKSCLEGFGLTCERYSKYESRSLGKTPDFKIFYENEFVFYCEVKTVEEDDWLDNQIAAVPPGEIAGGLRNDPAFNNLTGHIQKAAKQFNNVNHDRSSPNVMILINKESIRGFDDLLGVLTGNIYCDDGRAYPIYRNYSDGRIKDKKALIDLYLWLDEFDKNYRYYSQVDQHHFKNLCRIFGDDPESMKVLG